MDYDYSSDIVKKAMAYDLRLIFGTDREKTFTGQEVLNLIDEYIRTSTSNS